MTLFNYIIENIDTVLQMGVRTIAKNNYTSPASIIRLAKKLVYTGFIDMQYNLAPKLKTSEKYVTSYDENTMQFTLADILKKNDKEDINCFVKQILSLKQQYIFIYATGFSAASALSQQILQEGKSAVDRYIDFLKSGGSKYPLTQLKNAGVDMEKKEAVDKALEVFSDLVEKLEKEY